MNGDSPPIGPLLKWTQQHLPETHRESHETNPENAVGTNEVKGRQTWEIIVEKEEKNITKTTVRTG
jgi:hypothetical protein